MKIATPKTPVYLSAIAISCAAIATTAQVSANLNSERSESARQKALRVTAQHVIADTCWFIQGSQPLRIGDRLDIGSISARTPTACFRGNGQYGYAAYLNGQLQITQVFSGRELEAAKSMLKKEKQ